MTWAIAVRHHVRHEAEILLPVGLVGLALESFLVHARLLFNFFRGSVGEDEATARDFGVGDLKDRYLRRHPEDPVRDWLRGINNRVQHLNQFRPAPVDRHSKKRGPFDPDVGQHVEGIASAVDWFWEEFRRDLSDGPWAPIVDDIEAHARIDERDTELRLRDVLGGQFLEPDPRSTVLG